jgi:hypothetical protein
MVFEIGAGNATTATRGRYGAGGFDVRPIDEED